MATESKMVSTGTSFDFDLLETAREIGPSLSQYISEEEANRVPSRQTLTTLREAGLFRLLMPQSLGGIEADPLTTAKVVQEIALYNTTAAWSLMVANTSTWWCSRLSDKGIDVLYDNGLDTFIAGAFHPPMRATPVQNGYRVSGRSPLASNVHDAHWIFVTAFVTEGGEIKMNNGVPELVGVFLNRAECEIVDTWYTLGMRGTDSNDVAVTDVFVPTHLSYPLTPSFEPNRHYRGSLYKFPAVGISITCLIAPTALAIARNAINELKMLADKKVPFGSAVSIRERGTVQRKLGMAEALVQSSQCYLYQVISEYWDKTVGGESLSIEDRARILLAATHANQSSFQAVELMYSAAGTAGIYTRSKLSRYFCDAQVIRHHGFGNESRYETAAQIYFGLPPDLAVITF